MDDPHITSPTALLQRMAPLLCSIASEIGERERAKGELDLRIAALRRVRRTPAALLAGLEARALVHERELRAARAELLELGWALDARNAARLSYVGRSGVELAFEPFAEPPHRGDEPRA